MGLSSYYKCLTFGQLHQNEKYLLSCATGRKTWCNCNIPHLIKSCPDIVYRIASKYCDILKRYQNYSEYELCFGFGSFYEEIWRLSYSDANLVEALCDYACGYSNPIDDDTYYAAMNPNNISAIKEYKQIREKLYLINLFPDINRDGNVDKRYQKYDGRYPEIDEYILSGYIGAQMWNDSYVYLWIKYNGDKAYNIGTGYSQTMKTYKSYQQYKACFGYGSCYDNIVTLANEDGGMTLELCQAALNRYFPLILGYFAPTDIKDRIPLDIKRIIIQYISGRYQRID